MEVVLCLLIGYLLGCFNPAALLGKKNHVDLTQTGTRNLGASNALLVLGKASGLLVMVVDIAKAWLASKIAKSLFPLLTVAGLIAGLGAILGHIFPFHLGFHGGKGLAAFAGMVLAFDPWIFLKLLIICSVTMLIVNYGYGMPMSAGVLFPLLVWLKTGDVAVLLVTAAAGLLIIVKHWSNIERAKTTDEQPIRDYILENFLPKR